MTRKFPITSINHPSYDLKEAVEVEQQQVPDGWAAVCASLGMEGRGETWPLALQDLQDNIVAAVSNGVPEVMAAMRERPPKVIPELQQLLARPSVLEQVPKKVFVLLEGVVITTEVDVSQPRKYIRIAGVTSDERWAKRFKKWNPYGDYVEKVVDALEDDDGDEKDAAGTDYSGGTAAND